MKLYLAPPPRTDLPSLRRGFTRWKYIVTGLLVSVRNAVEAAAAIRGGAAIVDVKEPHRGSLGAASVQQWHEVVNAYQGQIPLSLALGELTDATLPTRLANVPEVQFVKIGLAGCRGTREWVPRWRWAIEQLPAGTSPVAVTYVDAQHAQAPDAHDIQHHAKALGCRVMLWDTHDKTRGTLLDHLATDELGLQVAQARQSGMLIVLAGSLRIADLPALKLLAPDYVAIRGAACAGSRTESIRSDLVEQFACAVAHFADL